MSEYTPDQIKLCLNDLSCRDPEDIDSDDFEVCGENDNGADCCAVVSIVSLAEEAERLIDQLEAQRDNLIREVAGLQEIREGQEREIAKLVNRAANAENQLAGSRNRCDTLRTALGRIYTDARFGIAGCSLSSASSALDDIASVASGALASTKGGAA